MTYTIHNTYEDAVANLPFLKNEGNEFREESANHLQKMYDSEERSDTDGFLSQFCSGLSSSEYAVKAKLAQQGGMSIFRVLVDNTTGELVSTKLYELANRFAGYGFVYKWKVVRNNKVVWITDYKRSSGFTKNNLRIAYMVAPAYTKIDSCMEFSQMERGRGTGGMGNLSVVIRMKRNKIGITV